MMIRVNPEAIDSPEMEEMTRLLNLRPGQLYYDVVVAPGTVPDPLLYPRPPSAELRITPRSTSQVCFYLSNGVEVPCEHLECGLVTPTSDAEGKPMDGRELTRGLFEVHACKGHKPPPTAYVAIKNRGYWYYIDDRDQASKSTLALVLQLSRLDFGTQKATGADLDSAGRTVKLGSRALRPPAVDTSHVASSVSPSGFTMETSGSLRFLGNPDGHCRCSRMGQ